jgi:hypothetical protein
MLFTIVKFFATGHVELMFDFVTRVAKSGPTESNISPDIQEAKATGVSKSALAWDGLIRVLPL